MATWWGAGGCAKEGRGWGRLSLKAGSRRRKIELINGMNPAWRDLSVEL
ncbi:MAG: hypothetical protein Q8O76_05300 [Chloroflexota bacterium]|nr:hypothetical protein [Chloroflexota bacterium]